MPNVFTDKDLEKYAIPNSYVGLPTHYFPEYGYLNQQTTALGNLINNLVQQYATPSNQRALTLDDLIMDTVQRKRAYKALTALAPIYTQSISSLTQIPVSRERAIMTGLQAEGLSQIVRRSPKMKTFLSGLLNTFNEVFGNTFGEEQTGTVTQPEQSKPEQRKRTGVTGTWETPFTYKMAALPFQPFYYYPQEKYGLPPLSSVMQDATTDFWKWLKNIGGAIKKELISEYGKL